MRTHTLLLASLLSLASLPGFLAAQITLSTTVFDGSGGPLLSGNVYTATSFAVPLGTTLTIQPGAILKLSGGMTISGQLDAQGTALSPIRITSLEDDSAGGDTNGDGAATLPQPGDWQGLRFLDGSATSVLDHAVLSYHGDLGHAGLLFGGADTAISVANTTLRDGASHGINLAGFQTTPSITGCELRDNAKHAIDGCTLNALSGLSDNTAFGNLLSDAVRVTSANLVGDATISTDNLIGEVLIVANNVAVGAGELLRFGPGVVVKFDGARNVVSSGTLELAGTPSAPVTLTSLHDDTVGGDTNKNAAASLPMPGDWQGIQFLNGSSASVITHSLLAYSGALGLSGLQLAGADTSISVSNTTVRDGASHAVNLQSWLSFPSFTQCDFRDNAKHAVQNCHINSLPGFSGNTASGNGDGNAVRVSAANLVGSVTITADNLIGKVLTVANNIVVAVGETLRIEAGVVVKFDGSRNLTSGGTVELAGTALAPVVFTSLRDDAHGGDSNVDGNASLPAKGDWQGLRLNATPLGQDPSDFEHVLLRYGGSLGFALLRDTAGTANLEHVRADHGSATGLQLGGLGLMEDLVAFDCNIGIDVFGVAGDVRRSTAAACVAVGFQASGGFGGSLRSCLSSNNGANNNWVGFSVGSDVEFSGGLGVPAGSGNLALSGPLFVDLNAGDLRLLPGTAAIDAGDPADGTLGQDANGYPRLLDGDLDLTRRVDMGAHEFSNLELELTGTPSPGGSLSISLTGHASFSNAWMLVGFGFGEAPTRFGQIFLDVSQPTVFKNWPTPPNSVPVALPLTLAVPFDLVLQAAAAEALSPTAAGNVSNVVSVRVE